MSDLTESLEVQATAIKNLRERFPVLAAYTDEQIVHAFQQFEGADDITELSDLFDLLPKMKIETCHFLTVTDQYGNEGIASIDFGEGPQIMIATTDLRLALLKDFGPRLAAQGNCKVELVTLSNRVITETYEPVTDSKQPEVLAFGGV